MQPSRITAVLAAATVGAVSAVLTVDPAAAATSASYSVKARTLTITGDGAADDIVVGASASGRILVNGGAVAVSGVAPTVGNTDLIQVYGQGGDDRIIVRRETRAVLPRAVLLGGSGDDTLVGSDRADQLLGQSGDDDLSGGLGDDVLSGGDGADRLRWRQADGNDRAEGGSGSDQLEVTGADAGDSIRASGVGDRIRVERVVPDPFAIDLGTTENLKVDLGDGDDQFEVTGLLTGVTETTIDGGKGRDHIFGSTADDVIVGGDGDDTVEAGRGDDVVFLGPGDDVFSWRSGDQNDVVEGQAGLDRLDVVGSTLGERFDVSANGGRAQILRDVATVALDLNGLERFALDVLGGPDRIVVGDLSGTGVTDVEADLSGPGGAAADGSRDSVELTGTSGDDDVTTASSAAGQTVTGLPARITMLRTDVTALDRVLIDTGEGDDTVQSALPAWISFVAVAGAGDDVIFGGAGNDVVLGNAGDDVLDGRAGDDVLDGGVGDDVLLGGTGTDVLLNGELVLDGRAPSPEELVRAPAAARRALR